MPRAWIWTGGLAVVVVTALTALMLLPQHVREEPVLFEPVVQRVEPAPLCPWREPEADTRIFFREGASSRVETRILSGWRVELTRQLGRLPEPEESILTVHRVSAGGEELGAVLTRRVKGEHGAIELVLATNPRGEVQGVRLQRMREPEPVAQTVNDPAWLATFRGRTHDKGWDHEDVSSLPEDARTSAHAIREGIRSLLVLQAASDGAFTHPPGHAH